MKIKELNDKNKKKNRILFNSYYKLKDQLEDATDGKVDVEDLPEENEMKITGEAEGGARSEASKIARFFVMYKTRIVRKTSQ